MRLSSLLTYCVTALCCLWLTSLQAQPPLQQLQQLLNKHLQAKVQSQYLQLEEGEDTMRVVTPFSVDHDTLSLTITIQRPGEDSVPLYYTETQRVALKDLQLLGSDRILYFRAAKGKVQHYYTVNNHGQLTHREEASQRFLLFIPFEQTGKKVCETIAQLLDDAGHTIEIADWIYQQP